MRKKPAHVLACTLLGGCACFQTHVGDSTCEDRQSKVSEAVQRAAYAVKKAYGELLPGDVDAKAYLAAARAYPLVNSDIEILESVELEVWTRGDCKAAVVVARCPKTKRVILADDTLTMAVDWQQLLSQPEPRLPGRPDPAPSCPRSPRS